LTIMLWSSKLAIIFQVSVSKSVFQVCSSSSYLAEANADRRAAFILQSILLSDDEIRHIAEITVGQRDNPLW
jgi:Na+-transporting NADH:ubiquinone oxidoreductase subunit NqrB